MPSSAPIGRPIRATAKHRRHLADEVPVEVFLDGFAPPIRTLAQELREVVLGATPDATERVRAGWSVVGFDLPIRRGSRFFAWVYPQREHVHLGFPQGDRLNPRDGLLEGAGITKRARWITYAPGQRIDRRLARELVLEAAGLAGIPRER
ncbi:MAG TPA: DUF1801 domain-containing protein [Candidatus Limnocylindrales bacterium]|nr:DUF1801 domain-containing protein [Candidatus Limnocylindrales bacterium]